MSPAGAVLAILAALSWGTSFPAIAQCMILIAPLWVTTIRFGAALPLLAAVTYRLEGAKAFRLEGRGMRVFLIGAIGMGGYNVFAVFGIKLAGAEHAALLFAMVPLLTALVNAIRTRRPPTALTLVCMLVALGGIALVITGGRLDTFARTASFGGDALLLIASFTWVYYTIARVDYSTWSALRFTTLTLVGGEIAIVIATIIASTFFGQAIPTAENLASSAWLFAYVSVVPVIVALLCYNGAIARLGPDRAALFINLVPVVTFGVQVALGVHLAPIEYAGAAIVLVALVANNLFSPAAASQAHAHPRVA